MSENDGLMVEVARWKLDEKEFERFTFYAKQGLQGQKIFINWITYKMLMELDLNHFREGTKGSLTEKTMTIGAIMISDQVPVGMAIAAGEPAPRWGEYIYVSQILREVKEGRKDE